jgi:hypothetical protein
MKKKNIKNKYREHIHRISLNLMQDYTKKEIFDY